MTTDRDDDWYSLLDRMRSGAVVPVIGPGLQLPGGEDGDVVEYLYRLQSEHSRSVRLLLGELRKRDLLLIGTHISARGDARTPPKRFNQCWTDRKQPV